MTEAEWLAETHPAPLLAFCRIGITERQLRLLACAYCRRIWDLLSDERARHAVEEAERFADGLIRQETLRLAAQAVPMPKWPETGPKIFDWRLVTPGIAADMTDPRCYAWMTAEPGIPELTPERTAENWIAYGFDLVPADAQAALLRDIFGNPFRPVAFDPAWRTSAVLALASGIYDDRAFDRLPILADALQDAGCEHPDVLAHCRGVGPHVRGCWVIDMLLGKS